MNAVRWGCVLLGLAVLSGCGSMRTITPGETRKIFGEYEVQSSAKWTRGSWRNVEIWTVDGPQLQQLRFYREMEQGDALFEIAPETLIIYPSVTEKWPKYDEQMLPHDVMEMVTATLYQWGAVSVRASRLRPAQFGGRDGFRFRVDFAAVNGLDYRGLAFGHIDDKRELYLVLYLGTRDHYFPKLQQEVEDILASVRWR